VDRARELNWLAEHRREYLGQWVVLDKGELIGSGSNPTALVERGRATGSPRPLVIHINDENERATGGWL
jgi:hypothetical protein